MNRGFHVLVILQSAIILLANLENTHKEWRTVTDWLANQACLIWIISIFFRNLAKFNGTSGSRARRIENENSNFRKWQFQFCNFQLSNNLIMCGTSILEEIQILNSVENFSTRKNRQFCSKIQLRIIFGHEKRFNNAYIRKWSILSRNFRVKIFGSKIQKFGNRFLISTRAIKDPSFSFKILNF